MAQVAETGGQAGAGDDYERAYVPPAARKLLSRCDDRSEHYEVRERLRY